MILSLLVLLPLLELILKFGLLSLTESESNYKYGTLLVKNDFGPLQQLITGVQWAYSWFMMSPMSRPLTVSPFHSLCLPFLLYHKHTNYQINIFIHNLSCPLLSHVQDIRNWIRNIEQHASDNVNKILIGNKADMDESKRAVPTSRGQALADEYGIKFFETSAKTNLNVEQVFFSIARDIKQRLAESETKAEPQTIKINKPDPGKDQTAAPQKSACCGT